MGQNYNELIKTISTSKPCQLLYMVNDTSTSNVTAKAYAEAAVTAINGTAAAAFESIAYNSSYVSGLGSALTGKADIILTLKNTGNSGPPLLSFELTNVNISLAATFKTALENELDLYYPDVDIADTFIRSIIIYFHE